MRRLPMPQLAISDVYKSAVLAFDDPALLARLVAAQPAVISEEANYRTLAEAARLDVIAPAEVVNKNVSIAEMKALYKNGMANSKSVGRTFYDQLMSAAPHATCPLCGQGKVHNLDHHLPQSKYPSLVVTPINLVPSCRDCNMTKVGSSPKSEGDQTIHPYFDDFTGGRWLYASVVEVDPPVVIFSAELPAGWKPVIKQRLENHMRTFKLRAAFTLYAGEELSQIASELQDLQLKGGPIAVRDELFARAHIRERAHRNSWQTAMFYGLATSDWFCNVGLSLLRPTPTFVSSSSHI